MDFNANTENFSPEYLELCAYFSQPQFEEEFHFVGKIMAAFPDLLDRKLIANAAAEMLTADDEGVFLSPEDAVRLAQSRSYMSAESAAKILEASGITTLEELENVITKAMNEAQEAEPGETNEDAEKRAEKLRCYAEELAKNEDIILLGLPVFAPGVDVAWVKLAFLGGKLNQIERKILRRMRDTADEVKLKTIEGVLTGIFEIHE